jgi:hypothetical protein
MCQLNTYIITHLIGALNETVRKYNVCVFSSQVYETFDTLSKYEYLTPVIKNRLRHFQVSERECAEY